jgi:hypothetical protein
VVDSVFDSVVDSVFESVADSVFDSASEFVSDSVTVPVSVAVEVSSSTYPHAQKPIANRVQTESAEKAAKIVFFILFSSVLMY